MAKTVRYYNIAIFKNDIKTDLSLLKFLNIVGTLSWKERLRKIDEHPTAIHTMDFYDKTPNFRIIPFVKYRQNYKPYIGHIESPQDLEEIKDDIVEMVTMLYDDNKNTIALESTMHGLRVRGVERYLESFLPQSDEVRYRIKLEPIMSFKGIKDIKMSSEVKMIELDLLVDEYTQSLFKKSVSDETDAPEIFIMDTLRSLKKSKDYLDANKLRIEFGAGQGKNKTMELGTVIHVLELLKLNKEHISKLKVRYRDIKSDKLETVDLKNDGGPLVDTILEYESTAYPGWEYVGAEILKSYLQFNSVISESYRRFSQDMIHINRYEANLLFEDQLVITPLVEHRVELN
ncbi:MAG TPA: DUF6731 family protein [Bacillota bacterium]|nr:DUF6731 family protein [Bacillota bacterium]